MRNTIIIVDDELLFREGMKRILGELTSYQIIGEAENGQQLLDILENGMLPDLVLMDLSMPVLDGPKTLEILMEKYPDLKVAILSSYYDPGIIVKLIEMGAVSFMAKNTPPTELVEGLDKILTSGFHYTSYILKLLREKMKKATLGVPAKTISEREIDVLKKLCEQKTAKEIASELFISPRTVEGHRKKLLEKTNSKNLAGLILYAVENAVYKVTIPPFESI